MNKNIKMNYSKIETIGLTKTVRPTLAEKFQQEANVTFPPELVMEHTCYDPSKYIFYIEKDSDHASCQYQGKGKVCKLTPTPLSVVIVHKMGHAMGEKDNGPGQMNNVKKHENPVRKEMGIPPRMKY
ncbi:hypothetical protein [Kluyvera genomosp. 3]|uniref:hypothetical protein n=1 Tax=Kluyvera genomosp. 3 TaxID=2774055 RepID=UPI001CC7CC7F|nr:hypothetical protein [Kluyvera genomosp. 3]